MNDPALTEPLVADADAARAVAFACRGAERMTAGTLERWTFRFEARIALPPGSRLAIAHRWPSDWGTAQADDPAGIDYLEACTSDGASLRWWSARFATWHPFDHILFVELPEGLAANASVELRYGEARGGSPGFRVQSFIEEACPFSLRWRAREGGPWVEFARHAVRIVGAAPSRLVMTAPSQAGVGEPCSLHLRIEDRWGNPASLEVPVEVEIGGAGNLRRATLPLSAHARVEARFEAVGIQRPFAHSLGAPVLEASANPVKVELHAPSTQVYWGDLHGQSIIGCGARSIDAYYEHARDFAGSDFCSHQANCFLVSNDEWRETEASSTRHHAPGRYVTYLGVEWSAASPIGGDHNLYFPGDTAPLRRCSHEFIADKSDVATDLPHVEDLHRHYRGSDTLIAVHVGGRTANLQWHEPGLDRLLEVHSTHATSEWFLLEALARGYRMGVIAGSDGVDGRPGNSHPGHMGVRNVRGGLTAIMAPALTREALWQALRERHCYATTGERILLSFARHGAGMGDAVVVDSHRGPLAGFEVAVEGSAPLERIDFFRGTHCLSSVDLFASAGPPSQRLRVAWKGASAPGNWQRARMRWDGELRVEGATILDAHGHAFDTPDEGIVEFDAHRVRWRSVTAGDWDGVVLSLDRAQGELWFVTEPMSVRTRLDTLHAGERVFDAHQPERSVELRRLPERMPPLSFRGRFADPDPPRGASAYWVRVRQSDGAQAWSSPIFVEVVA